MKSKLLAFAILVALTSNVRAHDSIAANLKFKYKIWVHTTSGNLIKGILLSVNDSSVRIFPGEFSQLKKERNSEIVNQSYTTISDIYIRKKAAWLKGMGIGALIGISPIIFGQAGAYIAIVSFPVGIVTGTIVGATSRKKFNINSSKENFAKFRQKVSKK